MSTSAHSTWRYESASISTLVLIPALQYGAMSIWRHEGAASVSTSAHSTWRYEGASIST
jgi:hypothetical protein